MSNLMSPLKFKLAYLPHLPFDKESRGISNSVHCPDAHVAKYVCADTSHIPVICAEYQIDRGGGGGGGGDFTRKKQ